MTKKEAFKQAEFVRDGHRVLDKHEGTVETFPSINKAKKMFRNSAGTVARGEIKQKPDGTFTGVMRIE